LRVSRFALFVCSFTFCALLRWFVVAVPFTRSLITFVTLLRALFYVYLLRTPFVAFYR
jgi:hypothetical protein